MSDQYDKVAEFERGEWAGYTAELVKANPLPSVIAGVEHVARAWSPESVESRGVDFARGFVAGSAEYHADKTREKRE